MLFGRALTTVVGGDLLMDAFLPLTQDKPQQTTHSLFFILRPEIKWQPALTLMYEHLIEGKIHSADPLNLNPR